MVDLLSQIRQLAAAETQCGLVHVPLNSGAVSESASNPEISWMILSFFFCHQLGYVLAVLRIDCCLIAAVRVRRLLASKLHLRVAVQWCTAVARHLGD